MYTAEELEAMEQKGLLSQEGDRPNRKEVIRRLIDLLIDNYSLSSLDEVNSKAATIADLTEAVFGAISVEGNMDAFVGSLCTARGPVQLGLNGGGLMLCAAKIKLPVTIRGKETQRLIGVRYVTSNDEAILQHAVEPALDRAEVSIRNQSEILDLTLKRRPELAERIGQLRLERAERISQVLLPVAAGVAS